MDKMGLRLDIERMNRKIREEKEKRQSLKEMELFVLDNSLRESTVGQLRGHTIENKWKIYEEVRDFYLPYLRSLKISTTGIAYYNSPVIISVNAPVGGLGGGISIVYV